MSPLVPGSHGRQDGVGVWGKGQAECVCACRMWVCVSEVGPQAYPLLGLLWVWPAPPTGLHLKGVSGLGLLAEPSSWGQGRAHSIVNSCLQNFLSNHSSLHSLAQCEWFWFEFYM